MKLNRKILLITSSILFVALLTSAVVAIINFRNNYTEALITGSYGLGNSLNSIVTELLNLGLPLDSFSGMDKKCRQMTEQNKHISYVGIGDLSGNILYHSDPALIGKVFTDEIMKKSIASVKPLTQTYKRFDGFEYYDVMIPLFNVNAGNEHVGMIRLGFRTSVINDKVVSAIIHVSINFLISFCLIALLINYFMSRFVSRPVIALSNHARAIAKGDYGFPISLSGNDEVGMLANSLNQMSETIKAQMDSLQNSRDDLEVMVARRTDELEKANAQMAKEIEERKRSEAEREILSARLQRSEKMEALGQLAGGVAHDLNNVLGVLSGYSELIMEQMPEGDPLKKYVAHILSSTGKAATIVQDLLTLARRGVIVAEVVDCNRLFANLFASPEFVRLKECFPAITFAPELEQSLLPIKGSPVHLEKTVLNLISNAAEAISGTGAVVIRTENRYLDKIVGGYDSINEGDYVVLSVSDTGSGISPEDMDRMFEPFYTKKKMGKSGTGLGLSIVWGTVKDHSGYIDVQSVEGQGTTFTMYFPATRETQEDDVRRTPVEEYLGQGERVLVVDDVEEQRQVATDLLKQLGYNVHAVSGGEEAIEYLRSNQADIIVLDMIMAPGIDGLETYRRVLQINPHQKAILASGFSETERVREAQKLGAGSYVKKPYLKEKIGIALRDELARK